MKFSQSLSILRKRRCNKAPVCQHILLQSVHWINIWDQSLRRIQRQKDAKNAGARLIAQSDQVVVIHYACESFYNAYYSGTPITSISVRNLSSGQTTSVSIHQMAERKGYSREDIGLHHDELEKSVLHDFYKYVNAHSIHWWLHWNMGVMNFGFQAH